MKISQIVKKVNEFLAGEQVVYSRMKLFLDEVIDDINIALNSKYPTFSDLGDHVEYEGGVEYNFFPDSYIRSVVCKGAAAKFYTMDEEGSPTAEQYAREYATALFYMTRDYIEQVPEEFKADYTGSVLINEYAHCEPTPFNFGIWRY